VVAKAVNWASVDLSGKSGNPKNPGGYVQVMLGGVELPVSQFTMTYELNSIPTATVLVALGRNAATGAPSAIYKLVSQLKMMIAVTVKLMGVLGDWSTTGTTGQKIPFPTPKGGAVLFVGYLSGISYRRSSGQVSAALSLTNQLVDLTMASGGSADVVPGNYNDYFLPLFGDRSGAMAGPNTAIVATRYSEALPNMLRLDFSKGILDVLHAVASANHLQHSIIWCGVKRKDPLNTNTLALAVIEGTKNANGTPAVDGWQGIANYTNSAYTTKYPMDIRLTPNALVAVSGLVGARIAGSLAATSLWGTLIQGILPEFGCAVIPMAQTAIIAPLLVSARDTKMVIASEDYADFDMTTMSQRPLGGVGVMGLTTVLSTTSASGGTSCIGASYSVKAPGMWMFVPAPEWISSWVIYDPDAKKESAVNLTLSSASVTALISAPIIAALAAAKAIAKAASQVPDWNAAMTNFAKLIYSKNALRGREGTLTGKLRFDVAPGTTIRIKAGSAGPAGIDKLATDLVALVVSVVVNINAEDATAATTFRLTNIRTEAENAEDRFTMTTHPFFGTAYFKGAPLVPALTP